MNEKPVQGILRFRPSLRGTSFKSKAQAAASKFNFTEGFLHRVKGALAEIENRDHISSEARYNIRVASMHVNEALKVMSVDKIRVLDAIYKEAAEARAQTEKEKET